MKATRLCFLLGTGILTGGCDGEQSAQSPPFESKWAVSAQPRVVIGGHDERQGYLLHAVAGATRLTDGRIVVADQGSGTISFYDPQGIHLLTVGGKGGGPGEYQLIIQIRRLPGDTLLVLSRQPGLTWLSPEGRYLRSARLDVSSLTRQPCRMTEEWHLLGDGSILSVLEDNFSGSHCPPRPENPWRQSGLIARSVSLDGHFDTLGIFPATERNSPNYRAYGKRLVVAFGQDRVYSGDTGASEIPVLDFGGDTLDILSSPFEPVAIPAEAKQADVRRSTLPDGTVRSFNRYDYPDYYPLFGRLLADELGNLWVMAYPQLREPISSWRLERLYGFVVEEGGARWRVLDPNGKTIAEVRTPPGFFPLEVGRDHILGVHKDEFDVQSVQIYALDR